MSQSRRSPSPRNSRSSGRQQFQHSLTDAIRAMRAKVRTDKRHARTAKAALAREEFIDTVKRLAAAAIRLHEAGKVEDECLRLLSEDLQSTLESVRSCAYNRRSPGHALEGFSQFDLRDRHREPAGASAREILKAAADGLFDRLLGDDNPCADDTGSVEPARYRGAFAGWEKSIRGMADNK